ncbi:MAG: hypothetical protein IPF98_23185 [Gemmatimonadetes bacterium]|nr:hypothetical protein [Gemmatimonadota bacterium]
MNAYFAAAGGLAFMVGLAHSILGERLVFSRMRAAGLVPTQGGTVLLERHVRILWATWHVVTAIGWCLAAVLVWLSLSSVGQAAQSVIALLIAAAMGVSALLVLVGTKGRHPGWVGLAGVAVLAAIGVYR